MMVTPLSTVREWSNLCTLHLNGSHGLTACMSGSLITWYTHLVTLSKHDIMVQSFMYVEEYPSSAWAFHAKVRRDRLVCMNQLFVCVHWFRDVAPTCNLNHLLIGFSFARLAPPLLNATIVLCIGLKKDPLCHSSVRTHQPVFGDLFP